MYYSCHGDRIYWKLLRQTATSGGSNKWMTFQRYTTTTTTFSSPSPCCYVILFYIGNAVVKFTYGAHNLDFMVWHLQVICGFSVNQMPSTQLKACFLQGEGLTCISELEGCVSRATHTRQVVSRSPEKKGVTLVLHIWGWGMGLWPLPQNQQRSIFYAVKAHGIRGGLSKIMVLQSYVVASFAV
jgi:hypothetical protein